LHINGEYFYYPPDIFLCIIPQALVCFPQKLLVITLRFSQTTKHNDSCSILVLPLLFNNAVLITSVIKHGETPVTVN
jgi:hypothetical protein